MIRRVFAADDYKNRSVGSRNLWDGIYNTLDFKSYISTLEYDDATELIKKLLLNVNREEAVLDAGCGCGRHIYLLQKLGFNNITGADLSTNGLCTVRRNLTNVNMAASDISSLPLKSNSFGIILMVGVIYEIENPEVHFAVIKEIQRVLKPGGKLIFVNNSPNNFGEKIFSFTQIIEKHKNQKMIFFIWKIGFKDVKLWCDSVNLKIKYHKKINYGRALYRFFYGVFVAKSSRESRKSQYGKTNTYDLHEHYLANRNSEYFNYAGKIFLSMKVLLGKIFFASEVYCIEKP